MSLPAMLLHIGDYRRDTGHLRAAGHGAYLLLIMHYWATGGLPDDDEQLATIACMSDDEWRKWRPVIERFFEPGWTHKRVEAELSKARDKYQRLAKAGREGGIAKAMAQRRSSDARQTPEQPKPKSKPKEDIGSGGGETRARDPAFDLAFKIGVIAGYPDATYWPTGWSQAPIRVQLMLDHGWEPEIMLAAAREAMAKRASEPPPYSVNFFEQPFARAHARAKAPLPTAVFSQKPGTAHAARSNSVLDVIDQVRREIGSGGDQSPFFRLSAG